MPNRKNFSVKVIAKVTVFGIKATVFHGFYYTNDYKNTLIYYITTAKQLQYLKRKNCSKSTKNIWQYSLSSSLTGKRRTGYTIESYFDFSGGYSD
jgi:hypothetical protein